MTDPQRPNLTPGEWQALYARDKAETDAEAAAALMISVHTLRMHLQRARDKLGVRTTHRAIAVARQLANRTSVRRLE